MTLRRICTRLVLVGVLMALLPSDGWAGSTGKINGVVRDAEGGVLPGVNVVLTGTRQGATTDADGYYFILNVDPGSHVLAASLVGFTTERQQGVLVRADFTTKADFSLNEAAIELGEMVVVAERAAVEPDKTMRLYIVGAEDIQNVSAPGQTTCGGRRELVTARRADGTAALEATVDLGDHSLYEHHRGGE